MILCYRFKLSFKISIFTPVTALPRHSSSSMPFIFYCLIFFLLSQVEKCSFTPQVYSTTGGMGPLATAFHQRLASLVAEKRQERYGDVLSLMRTKLSFALLKSVLVSIRGARGKTTRSAVTPLSCVSFNLVPEGLKYSAPNKFE